MPCINKLQGLERHWWSHLLLKSCWEWQVSQSTTTRHNQIKIHETETVSYFARPCSTAHQTQNSAGFRVAEKVIFGHLTSIFTASRQMVEYSTNRHSMCCWRPACQPLHSCPHNATMISIFFLFLLLCFLVSDHNENDILIKGIQGTHERLLVIQ